MDKVSYSKMFAVVFSAIIAAFAVILLLYVFSLEAQQEIYEEQMDLINKTITIDAIQFPQASFPPKKLDTEYSNKSKISERKEPFEPDLLCRKYLEIYYENPSDKNKKTVSEVCDIY